MIDIEETSTQVQSRRGRELQKLMNKCSLVPGWDGIIRNGYVTFEDCLTMKAFSSDLEVQAQLVLQKRAKSLKKNSSAELAADINKEIVETCRGSK